MWIYNDNIKRIHVNQHNIRANAKTEDKLPSHHQDIHC